MSSSEAVAAGMALRRTAPGLLLEETIALADTVAESSPGAIRAIKRLIRAPHAGWVTAAREREDAAFAKLLGLTDPNRLDA